MPIMKHDTLYIHLLHEFLQYSETMLSLTSLLAESETPESFFASVRQKELSALSRWNLFLTNLAKAVNMLHLIYDTDFILGGYLAQYLHEEDISFLHTQIQQMTPFTEAHDFLLISKMPKHNISIGAALPYIQAFLSSPDL